MILTYDYASMRDITIRPAASFKDNNTLFVYLPGWIRIQGIYFTQLLT